MFFVVCSRLQIQLHIISIPGVYRNYGWEGLAAEVEMDVKRISHRNLGRDDRSVCTYVTSVATLL